MLHNVADFSFPFRQPQYCQFFALPVLSDPFPLPLGHQVISGLAGVSRKLFSLSASGNRRLQVIGFLVLVAFRGLLTRPASARLYHLTFPRSASSFLLRLAFHWFASSSSSPFVLSWLSSLSHSPFAFILSGFPSPPPVPFPQPAYLFLPSSLTIYKPQLSLFALPWLTPFSSSPFAFPHTASLSFDLFPLPSA